jgi:uncharacterized protein YkwD
MRRKPVVVVGMAAVLLAVGGVAATRAGAEETPEWPDVPGFSLSDLPGFSGFGDNSDVDRNRGSDDSDVDANRGSGDSDADTNRSSDDQDAADTSDADGSDVSGSDAGNGAETGGGDDVADHRGAAPKPVAAAHAVQEKPAAQKAAAVPARPRPALVRQDAGGSLVAAAKQNVTAADISASPNAPVQQQILTLINQNRRGHGCANLTLDRRLIDAANGHAADMARHDYFAHESPDGEGAGDRVTDAGYNWRHYGENIARGVDSPYAVVDGWMHSPEHRHNILDCGLDQMGVGLAIAGDSERTIYWVQDFATPM